MIRSFQHKGLEAFFRDGSKAGIRPDHAHRLQLQLGVDQATGPQDMAVPGWKMHSLKGRGSRPEVMRADTIRMRSSVRGLRPFVMTNLKTQAGLAEVVAFIEGRGMLGAR